MKRYLYRFVLLSQLSHTDWLCRFMIAIEHAIISLQRSRPPLPWFLVGDARTAAAEADRNIDEFQISDACREQAIGTTVRRRWILISHIVTLSFPRTHDLPSYSSSLRPQSSFIHPSYLLFSKPYLRAPHTLAVLCLLVLTSLFSHYSSHVANKKMRT